MLLDKRKAYCIILKIVKKVLFKLLFLYIVFFLSLFFIKDKAYASELISPWSTTTSLPFVVASHTSFSFNNYLYVVSGSAVTGESKDLILNSTISSNGTISNWNSSSTVLPEALIWHSTVRKDNYVYVLGGREENPGSALAIVNNVYLGKINNSGDIDSWTAITPLPENLAQAAAAVVGNKIYVTGGFNPGMIPNQDIYAASINTDGTVSSWTDVGNLPVPLFGHGMVAYGGRLIVLGGSSTSSIVSRNNTYVLSLDSSGFISGWQETSSFPAPIYRGSFVADGNKLFAVGGYSNGTYLNKVYYATANSDGTLGSWITSIYNFPQTICCGAAAVGGNFLYYTGGHNGSDYLNNVYFTEIASEPSGTSLPVPLLKQTSEPWQGNEYDSATKWSSNPTINRWGCALTSATMVLNFHGITKLTTSTDLDPGTLNTWLKSQKDGYVRNGLINWLAISRLSKKIKSLNPSFTYGALEYKRISGMNNTQLTADLSSSIPGILEEPGHFIVAKGKNDTTYLINDPFYNRTDLTSYSNSYLSLGRYVPSNTDLSYIMLVTNPEVSVELTSSSGTIVGEEYIQQPIQDPLGSSDSDSPVKIIYYPQPQTDTYRINVVSVGNQAYELDSYLYDENGEVNAASFTGILDETTEESFTVEFDKNDASASATKNFVTFEEFYQDIKTAQEMGLLNRISTHLLNVSLKNIENDFNKDKKAQAIKKLDILKKVIEKLPKRDANEQIITILMTDLEGLGNYIEEN